MGLLSSVPPSGPEKAPETAAESNSEPKFAVTSRIVHEYVATRLSRTRRTCLDGGGRSFCVVLKLSQDRRCGRGSCEGCAVGTGPVRRKVAYRTRVTQ